MKSKKLNAGWDNIEIPGVLDNAAYCLEITGDSMLPVYREGDVIIVSPKAALHKGDRVVVKTTDGKVAVKVMQRKTAKAVELTPLNTKGKALKLAKRDVDWMARIIWASQ